MARKRACLEHLGAHGPTPYDELPNHPRTKDKMAGLAVFKIPGSGGNGGGASGATKGKLRPIAYLMDRHTKEEVVRAFLDANRDYAKDAPRRGLVNRIANHGREWRDVARVVLDERGIEAPKVEG